MITLLSIVKIVIFVYWPPFRLGRFGFFWLSSLEILLTNLLRFNIICNIFLIFRKNSLKVCAPNALLISCNVFRVSPTISLLSLVASFPNSRCPNRLITLFGLEARSELRGFSTILSYSKFLFGFEAPNASRMLPILTKSWPVKSEIRDTEITLKNYDTFMVRRKA